MKCITCLSLATVTGLLLIAAAPVDPADPTVQEASRPNDRIQRFDLDFEGGTAAAYVRAVRAVRPDANIVLMTDAADVPMPPVQLKSVTLDGALAPFDGLRVSLGREFVELALVPHREPYGAVELYTVVAERHAEAATTQVYSVSEMLDGKVSSDDMLTAIETTLDMLAGTYAEAQIRFHPETGILIVRGHPEQVDAVQDVVRELMKSSERRRAEANREQALKQTEADLAKQVTRAMDLQEKLDQIRLQAVEWESRYAVLQKEFDNCQRKLAEREHENMNLTQQIRALEMEISDLRRGKDR